MKHNWHSFWKIFLRGTVGTALFVYVTILLVDPFDTLFFSPPLDRAPMATNQRFSYPVLARNPHFDSAVIGSSSIRLFQPEVLNKAFGGTFVNLAANAARPYEIMRFLKLFIEHHPQPRFIIVGLDMKNGDMWCKLDHTEKYTPREFPEWMFDDNPWNDVLYQFNAKAVEVTGQQIAQLLGWLEPRYERDGFKNFTPDLKEYDLMKARNHIYGSDQPQTKPAPPQQPEMTQEEQRNLYFPALTYLEEMLDMMPKGTNKILVMLPRHWYVQPVVNTRDGLVLEECKQRIIAMNSKYQNSYLVDFTGESEITTTDSNYWDDIHFNIAVADQLVRTIAESLSQHID